jgi:hypothetical protein
LFLKFDFNPEYHPFMHRSVNLISTVIAVLAISGCSNGVLSDLPLVVVNGAPAVPPYDPGGVSIDVNGEITALGAKGSRLLVGTGSTVYGLGDIVGTLEEVSVWSDDPTVTAATGAVHAVGRRSSNVLVAADNGIFHTSGDKLLVSPASKELTSLGISSVAAESSASGERLWLATSSGLYDLSGGKLSQWTVEEETATPTVVETSGHLVFAAYGDRLYELNVETQEAGLVSHSFGTIHSIAHGAEGSVYIAADKGLFARGADGGYTQYTLSDSSEPVKAYAAVFDPKKGMFGVTAAGIVLAQPGKPPAGVMPLPESLSSATTIPMATADDIGNVWIGAGTKLEGLKLGSTLTFDADVVPVFRTYCGSCHIEGAQNSPLIKFEDYETVVAMSAKINSRISAGQMPPASATPMPAEAFEILLRWEASGRNR